MGPCLNIALIIDLKQIETGKNDDFNYVGGMFVNMRTTNCTTNRKQFRRNITFILINVSLFPWGLRTNIEPARTTSSFPVV